MADALMKCFSSGVMAMRKGGEHMTSFKATLLEHARSFDAAQWKNLHDSLVVDANTGYHYTEQMLATANKVAKEFGHEAAFPTKTANRRGWV